MQHDPSAAGETREDYLAKLNLEGKRTVWEGNHPKIDFIFKKTRQRLKPGMKVAEFGVGDGHLLRRLAEAKMYCTGLDISSYLVDYHSRRMQQTGCGVRFLQADIADPAGFDLETHDAVFCLDVLEHISEDEYRRAVENLGRLLRPGGLLIGTFPYRENLDESMVRCPQCGHDFHRVGHRQTFDPQKLADSLSSRFVLRELGSLKERKLWGLWRQRFRRLFNRPLYRSGDTCYFIAERVARQWFTSALPCSP